MRRKSNVTFEQKLSAVKDYLESRKSQGQLAKECNVSKSSVQQWISKFQSMGESGLITSWILKYNGHEKLKSSRAGGKQIMTKGRNTTFEERNKLLEAKNRWFEMENEVLKNSRK